jgi:hypothetical protein
MLRAAVAASVLVTALSAPRATDLSEPPSSSPHSIGDNRVPPLHLSPTLAEIRQKCWTDRSSGAVEFSVRLETDATGRVVNATASEDSTLAACVEREMLRWKFPHGPGSLQVPIHWVV